MLISAVGNNVIVRTNNDNVRDEGLVIVEDDNSYVVGVVVSVGSWAALSNSAAEERIKLENGVKIIYSKSEAKHLGCGFSSEYKVLQADYVVGIISEEGDRNE